VPVNQSAGPLAEGWEPDRVISIAILYVHVLRETPLKGGRD
jgi:hypothetical protein